MAGLAKKAIHANAPANARPMWAPFVFSWRVGMAGAAGSPWVGAWADALAGCVGMAVMDRVKRNGTGHTRRRVR